MRRLSTALTCLALVPALGGLAACSTSDTSDSSGTDRKSATSTTAPVAKQAGAGGSVFSAGNLATHLFEGVLEGAGAQGFHFLSDLLFGDDDVQAEATTAKLEGIQTQLDQIATRLDTIDDDLMSIKGQLANGQLDTKLDAMNGWNNKMTSLYREYFLPIASAAKDVSVAKKNVADAQAAAAPGTAVPAALTDALTAATTSLQDKRTEFNTAFIADDPYTVFANQHDEMYPRDPNVSSVFKLAGRTMEEKGYVTSMDSQRLSSLYLTLSDQEALSALLIIEHDKMFGADAPTQQRHRDQYVNNVKVEKANLAPEIPWGQVQVGQQMFTVPSDGSIAYQGDTAQPWLPLSPEGVQLGTPLRTFTSDNPGWAMPDDTQMGTLFNATKSVPALSGSTHLGSIWQGSGRASTEEESARAGWSAPMFWTTQTGPTNQLYCIINRQADHFRQELHRQYTNHHVAVMNEAAFRFTGLPGTVPDGPMTAFDVAGCDAFVARSLDPASIAAKVMLTRTVDANTQDYMAQRSTALPAPTS